MTLKNCVVKKRVPLAVCPIAYAFLFLALPVYSHAQAEPSAAPSGVNEMLKRLENSGLTITIADTVLPTLCNEGRGLLGYKCSYINVSGPYGHLHDIDNKDSQVFRVIYDESDIQALRHQMYVIDKYYHYQLKEQKKLKNQDLNLGEVIQSFYIKPPF